jgi:hypothetical protein
MSITTQNPVDKAEDKATKINTKEDIKKLGISKDAPIVRGVVGCVGLKVNIEKISGYTTFILQIKDPVNSSNTKRKSKQLPVGPFNDPDPRVKNLSISEARIEAEKIRVEYLRNAHQKSINPNKLTIDNLYSDLIDRFEEALTSGHFFNDPMPRTVKRHLSAINNWLRPCVNNEHPNFKYSHGSPLKICEVDHEFHEKFLHFAKGSTPTGEMSKNIKKTINTINAWAIDKVIDFKTINNHTQRILSAKKVKSTKVYPTDCLPYYQGLDKVESEVIRYACKIHHHIALRSSEIIKYRDCHDYGCKSYTDYPAQWKVKSIFCCKFVSVN